MNYTSEKPAGFYSWGMRKIFGDKNPAFPHHSETFGSTPTIPRPLLGLNENLGEKWDQELNARMHEDIAGAMSNQIRTTSHEYNYSVITLHGGESEPAIYGENSQLMTRSIQFFHGTLETIMPMGISVPRGLWEDGVEAFNEWYNAQLVNMWDTLIRGAQAGIYFRILNNIDGLKYRLRKKKEPLPNDTVQDYYEKFVNPVVNCFRRLNGFQKLITHDMKYMRSAYPERLTDGKSKSWIYLISPEADEFAKFEKSENFLFLFSGNKRLDYPKISMLDYSMNSKVNKDALYVIPNFHHRRELVLGKNIVTINRERPRYYRFLPWNMLNKEKVSLDKYDIIIIDDIEENPECRVKYIDAVKALPLEEIHKFWGLDGAGVGDDKKISFHQLVQKTIIENPTKSEIRSLQDSKVYNVIREITKGEVKSPLEYYMYIIDAMDVDDIVNQIKGGIINGEIKFPSGTSELVSEDVYASTKKQLEELGIIDQHPLFKKWLNKISPLVKLLGKFVIGPNTEARKFFENMITLFFSIYKIPDIAEKYKIHDNYRENIHNNALKFLAVRDDDNPELVIHGLLPEDPQTTINLRDFKNKETQLLVMTNFIFNKLIIHDNNTKKDAFRKIANRMIDLNICMPFGVFVFKRQIYLEHDTIKVRKQAIDQRSQQLFAKVVQDPNTADIHITVTKSYGENLRDVRDVKKYEGTFIEKCVNGGGNKIWKKPKDKKGKKIKISGLRTYTHGDLWIVPVTLNEVLGKRVHMINRTGWDNPPEWDGVLRKLRLSENVKEMFYYSSWKHCIKYYHWDSRRNTIRNDGEFHFNHKLAKYHDNHWAGWQKYVIDKSIEMETGPYKRHPCWWLEEKAEINTRVVRYNNMC